MHDDLKKTDKYAIPICGLEKISCNGEEPVCDIGLRLVKPCIGSDEESGSESSGGDNEERTPLFNKSSWAYGQFPSLVEPFKTYLDLAADRWNKLLSYNQETVDFFKNNYKPDWNGCEMIDFVVVNEPDNPFMAACGPVTYTSIKDPYARFRQDLTQDLPPYPPMMGGSPLGEHNSNVCFNSADFSLMINLAYFDIEAGNGNDVIWLNVMTHELGHALGFGLFWQATTCWLDRIIYLNAGKFSFYHSILGIPIEDGGGGGTAGAHWEYTTRKPNIYGPCGGNGETVIGFGPFSDLYHCIPWNGDSVNNIGKCDIMVGWITVSPITPATIGVMEDFGYIATGAVDTAWVPSTIPTNIPQYTPPEEPGGAGILGSKIGSLFHTLPVCTEDINGNINIDKEFKLHCRCHNH